MEIFVVVQTDCVFYIEIILSWYSTYEDAAEACKQLDTDLAGQCVTHTITAVDKGYTRPKTRPPGVPDTR